MEAVAENRRVLVIDDDAGVRHAYGEIFTQHDGQERRDELAGLAAGIFGEQPAAGGSPVPAFTVTMAPQGEAAAVVAENALANGTPYAVAFVDMRMPPGWDGLKTISELWKRDPNLQTVICTAYSDYSWEEIIGRLGRSDRLLILKKPFDRIEVMQLAEALCARWNLARAHEERTAELSRSRLRLRAIIDNDPALITLKDLAGSYLLANRTFCKRHGLDEAAIEGKRDSDLFTAHRDALHARDALALAGGYHENEEDDPRLPGARFLTVRFLLADHDGRPNALCTIATEVTKLKDLEARYRQSQKLEALGRLAGGVAHDFNNLLAAIIGFSDLVLSQLPAGHKHRPPLEQVVRAGQQAAELTGQLLAFSRRQTLKPKVIDLNGAILDQGMILKRLLGDQIKLHLATASENLPLLIDPGQLQQVVVNLAVNARDAMPDGGTLTITTGARGDQVELAVKDSGSGIPAELLDRIWDPFFTTKDSGKGTGLGLATVQGIVVQSGGRIAVESKPGQGATFVLTFPRSTAPVQPLATPPAMPAVRRTPTPGGSIASAPVGQPARAHILLVDDNDAVRQMASALLEEAGYAVTVCVGADEALGRFDDRPVDLVVSDVSMPGMGGPELYDRLRARYPELQGLFMTGFADRETIRDMPVLGKPFSGSQLVAQVRKILGR